MAGELLGQGLAFPLRLGVRGLGESAGVARVEESMRMILGTQYGERQMRPTFGCNLRSLVFAPNNSITANLAKHYVSEGLAQWELRIDVLTVAVTNDLDAARLLIEILYRLKATQDVRSLIYPFYLENP